MCRISPHPCKRCVDVYVHIEKNTFQTLSIIENVGLQSFLGLYMSIIKFLRKNSEKKFAALNELTSVVEDFRESLQFSLF